MAENRALALIPTAEELSSMTTIAKAMLESGYWPDLKSVGQALVKTQAGREYGYGPFEAMLAIAIVQGKPTLTAQAVASRIKASGKYNYRLIEHTAEACEVEFFEGGRGVGTSRFTIEDAKKANLTGKQVWTAYPESMLFARAITKGARMYAPDVFGAAPAYTAEELGADVTEAGEIVTTTARVVERPKPSAIEQESSDTDPLALNGEVVGAEPEVLQLPATIPAEVRLAGPEMVDAFVTVWRSLRGAADLEALKVEWSATSSYLRGLSAPKAVIDAATRVKDAKKAQLSGQAAF